MRYDLGTSDAPQTVLSEKSTTLNSVLHHLLPFTLDSALLPRLILISLHVYEPFAIYRLLEPACSVVANNGIDSTRPDFAECIPMWDLSTEYDAGSRVHRFAPGSHARIGKRWPEEQGCFPSRFQNYPWRDRLGRP